ncbi:hypothetical protein TI39_contig4202g00022 [Zymoseptoria brevis]|uniref:Uncharacterized protein n=1 Tax=Zymoseptoria brevis TaxID=1047168 RepID=A0A0F4GA93_9PEZI|nr:hypothetical protein TI39_contig4202g00022 [Zymoseptoria brevis]
MAQSMLYAGAHPVHSKQSMRVNLPRLARKEFLAKNSSCLEMFICEPPVQTIRLIYSPFEEEEDSRKDTSSLRLYEEGETKVRHLLEPLRWLSCGMFADSKPEMGCQVLKNKAVMEKEREVRQAREKELKQLEEKEMKQLEEKEQATKEKKPKEVEIIDAKLKEAKFEAVMRSYQDLTQVQRTTRQPSGEVT